MNSTFRVTIMLKNINEWGNTKKYSTLQGNASLKIVHFNYETKQTLLLSWKVDNKSDWNF